MAYTKIIVIHSRLDRCLGYTQDEEKTSLETVLDYAMNRDKIEQDCFETALNCDRETAYADMMDTKRRWGKASRLHEGSDVTIIATGLMVQEALKARELLAQEGISAAVLDMHTIKPLDEEAVLKAAEETGCIVTAEEANVLGGLGGAVAEVVSEHRPVPVIRVGVKDIFGRSGDPYALLERYGLTAKDVAAAAKRAVSMKK